VFNCRWNVLTSRCQAAGQKHLLFSCSLVWRRPRRDGKDRFCLRKVSKRRS